MTEYTDTELAAELRDLCGRMHQAADKMAAAENPTRDLIAHMGELRGAAEMARSWADGIARGSTE